MRTIGRYPGATAGLLGVIMLLAAAALAPAASAGCGGVATIAPTHHRAGVRPPLAIGDSTMLLALDDLAAAGYGANAHGCREYGEALALLRARKASGTLPHMVVIALGSLAIFVFLLAVSAPSIWAAARAQTHAGGSQHTSKSRSATVSLRRRKLPATSSRVKPVVSLRCRMMASESMSNPKTLAPNTNSASRAGSHGQSKCHPQPTSSHRLERR